MNISIIVGGRFHAFDLAKQLNNKNCLNQLITSYPKSYVYNNYNIPKNKINSIIIKEIIQRSFINKFFNFGDILVEYFDKKASKIVDYENSDLIIGWSSFSYHTFLRAKKDKCIKILERGSTHIEYQDQIMNEEYKTLNLKHRKISKFIIEKEKKEYELADYIMVPTEFARQTFIDKGFSKNKVIKNLYGVNLEEFKFKKKLSKKKDKFRILYVGTLSVRKGILYLLEVFDQLNLDNSELLLIGNIDKELQTSLKKYESNKKIQILKSVAQNKLKHFYNDSDLFILNSIEDGFGMVVSQAMACGLPVITTKNTGASEIIDDGINGFIIPIRDKKSLREKILFLYNNPYICNDMGEKAYLKATKYFSWEMYGQKAISIYQDLLKR